MGRKHRDSVMQNRSSALSPDDDATTPAIANLAAEHLRSAILAQWGEAVFADWQHLRNRTDIKKWRTQFMQEETRRIKSSSREIKRAEKKYGDLLEFTDALECMECNNSALRK